MPQDQTDNSKDDEHQRLMELLAAAGVLGSDHPVVDAMARMHQSRMMAQHPEQYPELGQSLAPKGKIAQKAEK
jgi:hypothetical protein